MSKVGIITMHRVGNYGSILQAYALQQAIDQMGFDAELIDYEYPNEFQYARGVRRPVNDWKTKVWRMCGPLKDSNRKLYRMRGFQREFYKVSKYFPDCDSLHTSPPVYDLYVTGSDQVWNPTHSKGDSSFLLDFIPRDAPRISYASSFSGNNVAATEYAESFRQLLSRYNRIAVRENSDAGIAETLTSCKPEITLDPTLLLDADHWRSLANRRNYGLRKGSYILLYVLSYAFDPRPYIFNLAAHLSAKKGLPVVAIDDAGTITYPNGVRRICDAGPREFLSLFDGASCVVTSSFHGCAFAVNFGHPVYGVVNNAISDSRISSFLNEMQIPSAVIPLGTLLADIPLDLDMAPAAAALSLRRSASLSYLRSALTNSK